MEHDVDKVDDMTLALLYLVASGYEPGKGARAWKGLNATTLEHLHQKGWILEPKPRDLSLTLTEAGYRRAEALFREHFGREA